MSGWFLDSKPSACYTCGLLIVHKYKIISAVATIQVTFTKIVSELITKSKNNIENSGCYM